MLDAQDPPAQDPRGGARVKFPPPLMFLILILVGVGIQYAALPLRLPFPVAGLVVGVVLVLSGLAWGGIAIRIMRSTGQDPRPWLPSPELIIRGPFRFSRNPIYVGMVMVQVGLGLALDDLWIVLLAPLGLALVHFIAVKPEEAYLTEKFGEPYRQYLAQVRRYL